MQLTSPQSLIKPLHPLATSHEAKVEDARKLKDAYNDFVGKTFFNQMLKSMRDTVGKPAYFHGGQTEEVFRSQLDQQMADSLSDSSADKFADPMFRLQFPEQAELLAAEDKKAAADLTDLSALRRR